MLPDLRPQPQSEKTISSFERIKNVNFLEVTLHLLPTATANVCNVVLMRRSELSEGVSVLDDDGNVVGTSKVAARHVRCFLRNVM